MVIEAKRVVCLAWQSLCGRYDARSVLIVAVMVPSRFFLEHVLRKMVLLACEELKEDKLKGAKQLSMYDRHVKVRQ